MAALCACSSVAEGQARSFAQAGETFIVVKRDNHFYVYLNRCPHLGIPLEWQTDQFLDDDGELLRCSTHGALFVIETGRCVAGPCAGERLIPVQFKVRDDQIWLSE